MYCISVVIIQNSGGSARADQIYRATHGNLHSLAAIMNEIHRTHRSSTVSYIIKSGVKLCADSWFMQDGLRKCHLSLPWEWFTELAELGLSVTDRTQKLIFFGDQAMVQKLGELILIILSPYSQKMSLLLLLKCLKVALILSIRLFYIFYIHLDYYKAIHHLLWRISCCVACSLQKIEV